MAQLTASNAAAFGHQGAHGGMAFYAASRPPPISLRHCEYRAQTRGYPTEYIGKIGAKHTASSESEGAAAATPSALNTPTGTTLTPAGFLISLAVNSQAEWRSLEENSPSAIARMELEYGCGIYLMDDATVGLGALFDTPTATDGDTGAALTLDGVLDSAKTIRSNLDDGRLGVSVIIDAKGADDLTEDIRTSGSGFLSSPGMSNFVAKFVAEDATIQDDDGFWFTPDGRTGVFVEPGYTMLIQQGGDRVGCAVISPTETVQGKGFTLSDMQTRADHRISPAFAICVQENPVSAAVASFQDLKMIDTPSGMIAVTVDANSGVNYLTLRGRGVGTVALINDNSACECRYLA